MITSLVHWFNRSLQLNNSSAPPCLSNPISPAKEDAEVWMEKFKVALSEASLKPKALRELGRLGIPEMVRGRAWCAILQVENVPGDKITIAIDV